MGREADFVVPVRRDQVDLIECTWDASTFDGAVVEVFRQHYPAGRNYLVTPSATPAYTKRCGSHRVRVCVPSGLDVGPQRAA
jgi:hypothetical protein